MRILLFLPFRPWNRYTCKQPPGPILDLTLKQITMAEAALMNLLKGGHLSVFGNPSVANLYVKFKRNADTEGGQVCLC